MLQNPFFEGMQREAKTIIEGHFKEADHLKYGNHIVGQNVRGPNLNAKRRSVTSGKGGPIRGTDLARPHSQSMLNG